MLRLGAIVIVLLPVGLGVFLRDSSWAAWLGPGLALVGGLAFAMARPHARSLVLLGSMLAVVAGLIAPQLSSAAREPIVLDLRTDQPTLGLRGPVVVTGFFRAESTMVEFAVPEGALPQQDGPAEALLVPLLGVEQEAAPLGDVVLIARVRPGREQAKGVQTIEGLARPLEPQLLATFLQASGVTAPPELEGVLVDAAQPPRAPASLHAALLMLAILAALVCLLLAARRQPAPPHATRA